MKKAEILSVGTELLMGQVANTDAQYISKLLPEAGFGVYYHVAVGDNMERVCACLRQALGRSDLVVMTGGLGPTQDDMTKKAVAEVLGRKLVRNEEQLKRVLAYFKETGRVMAESNLSQADFPEGAEILENDWGTAPGCLIRSGEGQDRKIVVMLPGPPNELMPMFSQKALPLLTGESDEVLRSAFFSIRGIPEATVEENLSDIITGKTNPTVATYVKDGFVTVRVSASGTPDKADRLIEDDAKIVRERFGDSLFSENGETVEQTLVKICTEKVLTFSSAESCTGGMIAEMVTSVPGASKVIKGAIVTYSNEAKINLVNVPEEVISRFGAVSEQTARAMAVGVRKACNTDIGVSVTGNAGPGVMEDKPAGLVYIGAASGEGVIVKEFRFRGNREQVRKRAANAALDMARSLALKEKQ